MTLSTSNIMIQDSSLLIFEHINQKDFTTYTNHVNSIDSTNPFYKIELVMNDPIEDRDINYFLYITNGIPKILMIFLSREIIINGNKTIYKDVVSPYGYSGPLISAKTTDKELIAFWESVDNWYRDHNIITEFIRFSLNNNQRCYSGKIVPTLKNIKGTIISEKSQWESFDKKVRNNYRRAVKSGLDFKLFHHNDINKSVVEDFHTIYRATMIRKHAEKELFFSLDYFLKYIENNPENCAIITIYYEGKAISSEFLLLSNDTIYSYLGGTLSEYFRTRPNDFLKVNVLNWGRERNFKYYLLGGGKKDCDQLYAYKKAFFPKDDDVIFYTGRKIINPEIYKQLSTDKLDDKISTEDLITNSKNGFFPAYRITTDEH